MKYCRASLESVQDIPVDTRPIRRGQSSLLPFMVRGVSSSSLWRGMTSLRMILHRRICHMGLLVLAALLLILGWCNTDLSHGAPSGTLVQEHLQEAYVLNGTLVHSADGLHSKTVSSETSTHKEGLEKMRVREDSVIESIKYQLIKSIMKSVITWYTKRKQSLAKHEILSEDGQQPKDSIKPLIKKTRGNHRIDSETELNNIEEGATGQLRMAKGKTASEPEDRDTQTTPDPHGAGAVTEYSMSSPPKKILIYTTFFGRGDWNKILGKRTTRLEGCPVAYCIFTNDTSEVADADALIFHDLDFHPNKVPRVRHPHQRYIWLTHESPGLVHNAKGEGRRRHSSAGFFNWTLTYHRHSDVLLSYGGLKPLLGEGDPARPGLLDRSGATYRTYMAALQDGVRLEGNRLGFEPWGNWSSYLSRPRLVSWMVSHCHTLSGRELYVQELQQHVPVDVYGACGPLSCGKSYQDTYCYEEVLGPNYKFYLAFENNLCDDYITEKVWVPLQHGLVPVVYGGAHYHHFLPPHSYVDATPLTPRQLARLLTSVAESPEEYGRYHVWRQYWRVLVPPPLCELCYKLHHDHLPTTLPDAPAAWWASVNNCTTRYPLALYPRRDLRLLIYDLKEDVEALAGGVLLQPLLTG